MGYQQGLSGLKGASSDLDVIGNNIANANTIGFKQGTAVFSDMYANSVATAVNNQVGIGSRLAAVQQQFSQGTVTTTGQALDVAINGNGFFQMSNNGATTYSRNGVFQLDKNGYITDASGLRLMGYAANSTGVLNSANTVALQVPTTNLAPTATSAITAQFNLNAQDKLMLGAPTVTGTGATGATITNAAAGSNNYTYTVTFAVTPPPAAITYSIAAKDMNNNAVTSLSQTGVTYTGAAIPLGNGETFTPTGTPADGDNYTVAPNPIAFNAADPSTYNYSTTIQTYDSLGGTQQVNMYFAKSAAGTWDVYAGLQNGTVNRIGGATFDSSGNLAGTTQADPIKPNKKALDTPTAVSGKFSLQIPTTDGSSTPQTMSLNIAGTTQYGSHDGTNNLAQDGYAPGLLSSFSVGADGKLTGTYSNGRSLTLGQIVLATFNNPNGLVNLGNNQYAQTAISGDPQVSTPGSTNHGALQGGAVEDSNVDLTSELVSLITAQRNYQSNAQTIKTQQTVDQTLMNL